MNLDEFKEKYDLLRKKYSLPLFEEMNSSFDIGKIKRDSGNLVRDIRHMMNDKISYYMRLIEVMVNPSGATPAFMLLLKEINKEDKKLLDEVFTALMGIEIESYRLNIKSSESEEAEFIKSINKTWKENKDNLSKIIGILNRNWKQTGNIPRPNKGYFN